MATAFFRTVILYLLLIAGLRITGKRQIGELEPIELVLSMLLSDLASVPMQDFGIPQVNGIVPIVAAVAVHAPQLWKSPQRPLPHASVRGADAHHPQRPHPAGCHAPQPPDGG